MIFPIFLLIFLGSAVRALVPLPSCSPAPSVTFRAGNDVTRGAGAAAIIFGPLQCSNCYNFMRRLNDICNQRSHRIFMVAPDFESNHIIQRTSSAFPNIQIDRAGEGWPRLGANNFDAMILDSCGRVAEVLRWPQTDVTTSSALLTALESANSRCGQCLAPGGGSSNGNRKKINAYIKEREREQRNREYGRTRTPHKETNGKYQQREVKQNYQNSNQNPHPINHQQNPYQHSQNHQQQLAPQFNPYSQNVQNPQINTQYQYNQQAYVQNPNYNFYTPPPPPPPPIPTKPLEKSTTTPEPIDYDYYPNDEDSSVPTTQSTQTQIPRPPISPPNWPTLSPFVQNQYQTQYQTAGHLPLQFQPNPVMENNLPCSAFTDDICYQQRERMGSQMSKCCNKGIYLTDVCVPGKCSNSTTQLCCFQKFLQAKYSCCNDPLQDEGAPKMTNMFNKCCYSMFVTEDPCCPELAARRYWSTTYEVCMPTVTVDFSPVRFEVHFTEGVRVLDLGTDRQWDFNCTYGKKRPQYAYLP